MGKEIIEASSIASKEEKVVTLVHWVKCMREITCVIYLRDKDVKIVDTGWAR